MRSRSAGSRLCGGWRRFGSGSDGGCFSHRRQPCPDRLQLEAILHPRRAEPARLRAVGTPRGEIGRIAEHSPALVVKTAFRRRALCQKDVVAIQFHMGVIDALGVALLHDGRAVYQVAGWDQDAVEEHCMQRRHAQITARQIVAQRADPKQDRKQQRRRGEHGPRAERRDPSCRVCRHHCSRRGSASSVSVAQGQVSVCAVSARQRDGTAGGERGRDGRSAKGGWPIDFDGRPGARECRSGRVAGCDVTPIRHVLPSRACRADPEELVGLCVRHVKSPSQVVSNTGAQRGLSAQHAQLDGSRASVVMHMD